jgi:ABC-2 type transport system ATP-binding protein
MDFQIGIDVKNIKKKMRRSPALNGITTSFTAKNIHGLIGPNGAGKTTLLRTLVGLLKPDEGEITFTNFGKVTSFDLIRPNMAYMPQQQSLYPDLSCIEHLNFFRDLYQIPMSIYKERLAHLLHMTRMEQFKDRLAGQLSGGMYKKLGLMCALLQSPNLILLDEPTNGVDPISRREFWELLYHLASQDILIIVSTSYMDEAERCTKVHILENGKVIATGDPATLLMQAQVATFDEFFLKHIQGAHHE